MTVAASLAAPADHRPERAPIARSVMNLPTSSARLDVEPLREVRLLHRKPDDNTARRTDHHPVVAGAAQGNLCDIPEPHVASKRSVNALRRNWVRRTCMANFTADE